MRKIPLIFSFLLFVLLVNGQQDIKARQILEEVSKKTRSYKNLSAEFIFSMENKEMDIDEKNEGSLKMNGQKYVVDLPAIGIKVFSDGQTIWNYMKDGNQVTISNTGDQGSEFLDPSSIFNIYEKGFISKLTGEKKEGKKSYYQIELTPEKPGSDITKIIISIDKAEMMVSSANFHSTDGNLYGVKIKKLDTDIDLPDSFFVFNTNEYEDVEVIDFR
ncbi:MAG: outer membrane lipoprotein carrier protein LolA [Prolixibacteraceae bacterium]|nr:outer membrane lipoprotein carrier protein LolA [Prolixibacteraceae bacterium]NLO02212.1 outer membrane lipoprotein carrier protein LolA [Bacteroidales bacterium]